MEAFPLVDFSKLKKRRPKNYTKITDEDLGNVEIVTSKKTKKVGPTTTSNSRDDKSHGYCYDELLERIIKQIKKQNPSINAKSGPLLNPPDVQKVGTTRSAWINFVYTCNSLNRTTEHLQQFILAELGNDGSLGQENQLIIKGRYNSKHIQNLLAKYINEYVLCTTCKSPTTTLTKDNSTRLQVMKCNVCGSTKTVANIKSSFKGR